MDFQNTHMRGLMDFINYAGHLKKAVDVGQMKLLGEGEDVVRLRTVHKSKGLEFPIVIVAGLGKRFATEKDEPVKIHKDVGIGLRWVDPASGIYKKTLLQNIIERKKEREDLAEEIRVLYVAFTRAMDKLILLGGWPGGAGGLAGAALPAEGRSFMQLLAPVAEGAGISPVTVTRADVAMGAASGKGRRGGIRELLEGMEGRPDPAAAAEIHRRLSFEYPFSAAAAMKSKYSASEIVRAWRAEGAGPKPRKAAAGAALTDGGHVFTAEGLARASRSRALDFEPAAPAFMGGVTALTAAGRGTAMHKVLEMADFRAALDKDGVDAYVAGLITSLEAKAILSPEEARVSDAAKIAGFLKSDICRRAAEAAYMRKEASFVCRKQAAGGEEVLIQGVIDCFFLEGDGFVLLDYKSGGMGLEGAGGAEGAGAPRAIDGAEVLAAERYRPQLEVYSDAIERIYGMKVAEAHLFLLDAGKDVILPEF
jgi:ATP-dependent helicase/nuclease subunit A